MPLLPALWLLLLNRPAQHVLRRAGGADPVLPWRERSLGRHPPPASASSEVALCLVVIGGASWDGLRARFASRAGV